MHLKTNITTARYGTVTVSTVDLHQTLGQYGPVYGPPYETCLFWNGGSEVVAHYHEWEDAEAGHTHWCQPDNAEQAIRDYEAAQSQR